MTASTLPRWSRNHAQPRTLSPMCRASARKCGEPLPTPHLRAQPPHPAHHCTSRLGNKGGGRGGKQSTSNARWRGGGNKVLVTRWWW